MKMFNTTIPKILNFLTESGGFIRTGIRHNCKMPAIVMNNGNEMPILGLGTWCNPKREDDQKLEKNSEDDESKFVDMALVAGYRHIDCAYLCRNENAIGKVIKKKNNDGLIKREDLFITSKLWNTFHDPHLVCKGCCETLEELGLDYLDMYLMHSPMGFKSGGALFPTNDQGKWIFSNVDYIDTWKAMESLVDKNMCKSIGISNFNQQQLKCLLQKCRIRPQTLQIELHPYLSQKELVHYAKWNDICVTAYSPLGSGKDLALLQDYKVLQLAERHKRTPAQILLRYLIQLGLAVIPKPSEKSHIEDNIMIFDFELCPEDMLNLDSLNHNLRYFQFNKAFGHPYHPFE